ncbi:Hypothetical_protein [Hexamita inflata]|nr:Hypothetical protein HINF_LOCUS60879 [Hexamita inflata]
MYDTNINNFVKSWGDSDSHAHDKVLMRQVKWSNTPKPKPIPLEHLVYLPHNEVSARYFLKAVESDNEILFKNRDLQLQFQNTLKYQQKNSDAELNHIIENHQKYVPTHTQNEIKITRAKSQLHAPKFGFLKRTE